MRISLLRRCPASVTPPTALCVIVSLNAEISDNFDLTLYTAQWSRLKGVLVIMWRGLRFV